MSFVENELGRFGYFLCEGEGFGDFTEIWGGFDYSVIGSINTVDIDSDGDVDIIAGNGTYGGILAYM